MPRSPRRLGKRPLATRLGARRRRRHRPAARRACRSLARLRRLIRRHGCYNRLSLQRDRSRSGVSKLSTAGSLSGDRACAQSKSPWLSRRARVKPTSSRTGAASGVDQARGMRNRAGRQRRIHREGHVRWVVDFDGCAFGGALSTSSSAGSDAGARCAWPDRRLPRQAGPACAGDRQSIRVRTASRSPSACVRRMARSMNARQTLPGSAVAYLDPIEQGSQPAWMSRMRFLRDGTRRRAPCPDAEEVRSGDQGDRSPADQGLQILAQLSAHGL
jgi:hypothetical protein